MTLLCAVAGSVDPVQQAGRMKHDNDAPDRPPQDDDADEAPETPLDEPPPPRVQDPPAEPDKRPYVVHAQNKPRAPALTFFGEGL
jgi:hypothetical protein